MPLPILEVLQVDDDVFVPVRARVLMPEPQQVQQLVQYSVNGCNLLFIIIIYYYLLFIYYYIYYFLLFNI